MISMTGRYDRCVHRINVAAAERGADVTSPVTIKHLRADFDSTSVIWCTQLLCSSSQTYRHSAHVCSSSLTLFSWRTLKEHIKKLLSPSARQHKPRTSLNPLKKEKDAKSSRSFGSRRPLEEIKCKKSEWEEPMSFFLLKLKYGSRWHFISSDDFRATATETNTSVQRTLDNIDPEDFRTNSLKRSSDVISPVWLNLFWRQKNKTFIVKGSADSTVLPVKLSLTLHI